MVGGPIFEGRNEILLLGKAIKFGVILQKYALKLIEIWKIIEKNREKNTNFSEFFNFLKFFGGTVGKSGIKYGQAIMGVGGGIYRTW